MRYRKSCSPAPVWRHRRTHRALSQPVGRIMVAQVHRFCLDRIVADYGLGHQRRSGNRPRHRTKLCSKRWFRQMPPARRRRAPAHGRLGAHRRFRHCNPARSRLACFHQPEWIIPVNVMAPTMQVACKAFIAPHSAARSPKERYTHVPRRPKASPPR